MAITCAPAASNKRPAQYGASAVGAPVFLWFALTPTAAWATNDQYKFCKVPKGHIGIDLVIDWPDMDSGANLVYDVGLYEDTGVDATIGTVVVTNEQPRPESRNRVLLPDVCAQFNVPFKDTFVMLRELAVRFDLVWAR